MYRAIHALDELQIYLSGATYIRSLLKLEKAKKRLIGVVFSIQKYFW